MTLSKTLINFYIPEEILQAFDRLCRLNGKVRSAVLNDLVYEHIIKSDSELPTRLDEVRRINENLKTAICRPIGGALEVPPAGSSISGEKRLKRKFSSFAGRGSAASEVR